MHIDDSVIDKLEILSKLKLSNEEKSVLKNDIGEMVKMFDKIAEVDTSGIAPLKHMTDTINAMRDDVAVNGLSYVQGLKNAPIQSGRYFAVPKVIE